MRRGGGPTSCRDPSTGEGEGREAESLLPSEELCALSQSCLADLSVTMEISRSGLPSPFLSHVGPPGTYHAAGRTEELGPHLIWSACRADGRSAGPHRLGPCEPLGPQPTRPRAPPHSAARGTESSWPWTHPSHHLLANVTSVQPPVPTPRCTRFPSTQRPHPFLGLLPTIPNCRP